MSSQPAAVITHPTASTRDITFNTWFSDRTLKSLLALAAASAAGAAAVYAYQRYNQRTTLHLLLRLALLTSPSNVHYRQHWCGEECGVQ